MRLAIACLLACLVLTAQAQSNGVYKWKDAKGVTHYSDSPPPAGRYGSVLPDAASRVAAPAKPDARCTTARSNIDRLKSGAARIGLDANRDGKPDAPMSADERTRQLALAEASAKTFCNTPAP